MQDEIRTAALAANRQPEEIVLIAVSKTHGADAVRAAAGAGVHDFGENYLQEAVDKIAACADLPITWHYIGAIQANKTRMLAENFHWIHTVDRLKIARRLNDQCPANKQLNICLQVNIDRDPGKAGVMVEDAQALLQASLMLKNLRVRGLMTILHTDTDAADGYQRLAAAFAQLTPVAGDNWDSLSMGMSGDYQAAICAGATHIRVGTAIFGSRTTANKPTQESP